MMPWKLPETSASYTFTWLLDYSALLGPIAGIMIADYFIIRRGVLDVPQLYRADGVYRYNRGVNPRAMLALALGVIPSVPGFLRALQRAGGATLAHTTIDGVYEAAWFVGFGIAVVVYVLGMRAVPPARDRSA